MSVSIMCPDCFEEFHVPEKYLGRNVKCSSCESRFLAEGTIDKATPRPQEIILPTPTKKPLPARQQENSNFSAKNVSLITVLIPSILGGLILGFIAGREHRKYQRRIEMQGHVEIGIDLYESLVEEAESARYNQREGRSPSKKYAKGTNYNYPSPRPKKKQ